MLADSHAEVLVHRTEHGNVRLPLPAFDAWVSVHPSQRGNEIDPTEETKHLHQPCKDPDRQCQWDDAVEAERLAEQHHGPDQQEAREHEHPPQQNQRRPSGVEPFEVSVAGLRKMSGYSKRFPSSAKVVLNQSGATIRDTPAATSTLMTNARLSRETRPPSGPATDKEGGQSCAPLLTTSVTRMPSSLTVASPRPREVLTSTRRRCPRRPEDDELLRRHCSR